MGIDDKNLKSDDTTCCLFVITVHRYEDGKAKRGKVLVEFDRYLETLKFKCSDEDVYDELFNERGAYFSGKVSKFSAEKGESSATVEVTGVGPIQRWWIDRQIGEDTTTLGFSTLNASYYLSKPNTEYAEFVDEVAYKSQFAYEIVDKLLDQEKPLSYSEFLDVLAEDYPDYDELLEKYGGFVAKQIDDLVEKDPDIEDALKGDFYWEISEEKKKKGKGKKAKKPAAPKQPAAEKRAAINSQVGPRHTDYRCDNTRFWLSAHNCQVPTQTCQNLATRTANSDFWSRLTHQLLGRLKCTISNLQIY